MPPLPTIKSSNFNKSMSVLPEVRCSKTSEMVRSCWTPTVASDMRWINATVAPPARWHVRSGSSSGDYGMVVGHPFYSLRDF